jgi:hypothetical protein
VLAASGYGVDCPEEYIRARAARYWGVPPWDPMMDSIYFVNLAIACINAEAELDAHTRNRSGE